MNRLFSVVLSGGLGSRLWPLSHQGFPKPFIALNDGETIIHKTYQRILGLSQANFSAECITVTNEKYHELHKKELAKLRIKNAFILEPFARDTAPAIAMAAHYINAKFGPDAIMLVLPADHLIENQTAFNESVQKAYGLASEGYLVSFGVKPSSPHTGFGYIECGEEMSIGNRVISFTEKPDKDKAEIFINSGNYLWNSGMYCFKAGLLLSELSKSAPDVSHVLAEAFFNLMRNTENSKDKIDLKISPDCFELVPSISIDYAVMEKSKKVVVVGAGFDWNDIGSWDSIKNLTPPDHADNRVIGQAFFLESSNVFVRSENKIVVAIGVSDLVVIDTPGALLVSSAKSAQKVKDVTFALKDTPIKFETMQEQKVYRPWGSYKVIEEGQQYKVKKIEVMTGASISLQKHTHRSEHWVIVSGKARIINGDQTLTLAKDESVYIKAGSKHRLSNIGDEVLVVIEVQTGNYLGEDDIVRFEDSYGRI